jgi:hypothetical protein
VAALAALGGPAQIMLGVARRRLPSQKVPSERERADLLVDVLLHGIGSRRGRR